jgi:hypothetical protein
MISRCRMRYLCFRQIACQSSCVSSNDMLCVTSHEAQQQTRGVINAKEKRLGVVADICVTLKTPPDSTEPTSTACKPHSLDQESCNVTSSHGQAILSIHTEWHLSYLATGFGLEASTRTLSSYLGDGAQPVNKTDLSTVCARVVISPQRSRFSALLPALLLYPPHRQPASCRGKAA